MALRGGRQAVTFGGFCSAWPLPPTERRDAGRKAPSLGDVRDDLWMFLLPFLLPRLSMLRAGSGVGTNTKVRPSDQKKVQDELEMPSLPPQSRAVSQGGRTQSEARSCGTPSGAPPAPALDPLWDTKKGLTHSGPPWPHGDYFQRILPA